MGLKSGLFSPSRPAIVHHPRSNFPASSIVHGLPSPNHTIFRSRDGVPTAVPPTCGRPCWTRQSLVIRCLLVPCARILSRG